MSAPDISRSSQDAIGIAGKSRRRAATLSLAAMVSSAEPMVTEPIAASESNEGSSWRSQPRKAKDPVQIDDAHPFDLDAYISAYTGEPYASSQ